MSDWMTAQEFYERYDDCCDFNVELPNGVMPSCATVDITCDWCELHAVFNLVGPSQRVLIVKAGECGEEE